MPYDAGDDAGRESTQSMSKMTRDFVSRYVFPRIEESLNSIEDRGGAEPGHAPAPGTRGPGYDLMVMTYSFGTEAINTITQLMENYRERVIVIFAGYPDKMKKFLEQNEGLMSRIAFHLNFPDYTAGELLEILKLHAEKREYTLTDSSLDTCSEIFENARCQENFGNGRYVRNLLEQAIIRQSSRLMKNTSGELTPKELCELRAEDFDEVVLGIKGSGEIKLGFAV